MLGFGMREREMSACWKKDESSNYREFGICASHVSISSPIIEVEMPRKCHTCGEECRNSWGSWYGLLMPSVTLEARDTRVFISLKDFYKKSPVVLYFY